jgi:hypothetical protein
MGKGMSVKTTAKIGGGVEGWVEGEGYLYELGMDGRGQFNLSFSLSICWPLIYLFQPSLLFYQTLYTYPLNCTINKSLPL